MKVFLSHARADSSFARALSDRVAKAGHDVWTDTNILPGDNWARQVDSALSGAEVFVALVSPEAIASEFVGREWQYALGQQRFENRLIPIEIKRSTSMPWIFGRLNIIRASSPDQAASEVLARLRSLGRTRASS